VYRGLENFIAYS